ncbi:MAG: cytochrome b N-terminal domain-containing protein [Magnetococcales bacterium]|nr:cytochrome b N-terminal domain-containing protein [Magnetococcales bacterium]
MSVLHRFGHRVIQSVEQLFNRIFGNGWNPWYHLGSLSFFLFWIVLFSGLYLLIFFETSLSGAYPSVERMTHEQWWLGGIMRSLHRYASDGAVITVVLHASREFFRDRYRGVRWFSWFTGVPTLWLVVLLGISGYWLVWDAMAQYIAVTTAELIDWIPILPGSMVFNFLEGNVSDRFFTLMSFLHLLALPVAMVFLLWTHVSRISQVDFMPPRGLAVGTSLALLLLSLIKPALSHGPANLSQIPEVLHLDWFYLNIYPVVDRFGAGTAWSLGIGITLVLMVLPWLPPQRPKPPAFVTLEQCNGCGQCAKDCPFGAVSMRPRTDGRDVSHEPTIKNSLCTSCGICVGSCVSSNPYRLSKTTLRSGMDMPHASIDQLRTDLLTRLQQLTGPVRVLLIGCQHGADLESLQDQQTAVLSLPCSGMFPPSLLDFALKRGADGILITGCRDGDCYYRIGNWLVDERLQGRREPHLLKRTDRQHIRVYRAAAADQDQLRQQLLALQGELRCAR